MTVKDITPTEDDFAANIAVSTMLVDDINSRWAVWMEMAKANPTKMSSPYMVVAIQLLGQAMMAMLCAQVAPPNILKLTNSLFDLYTDDGMLEKLAGLRDDKKEIMGFIEGVLMQNAEHLANRKQAN